MASTIIKPLNSILLIITKWPIAKPSAISEEQSENAINLKTQPQNMMNKVEQEI